MGVYTRPLLPLVVCLLAGIAAGDRMPGSGRLALWGLGAALVSWGIGLFRREMMHGTPLVVFFLLGYLSIQPWVSPTLPEHHIQRFADTPKRLTVTGVVREIFPATASPRHRFHMDAEMVESSGVTRKVIGSVRVTVPEGTPLPEVGDRIRFDGRIRSARSYQNPGGFDYNRYLRLQEILAVSYTEAVAIVSKPPTVSWHERIEKTRGAISNAMDRAISDPVPKALLKALLIGDRSGISQELREMFNRTGTGHLLAISGLHVGMLAAACFFFFRSVLAAFPAILWLGWIRKGAALLTLVPVILYGFIAGMAPSTQRAVLMGAVALMGIAASRTHDPLNTLGAAVLGMLVWHPPVLFSISFQLSVSAVGVIVLGFQHSGPGLSVVRGRADKSLGRRMAGWVLGSARVCLLATLGTLPLILACFNTLSLVGVGVNLAAVPLAAGLAVPIGLFFTPVLFVWEPLARAGWMVAGKVLSLTAWFIEKAAALPFSAVTTITPSGLEILLYYLTLGLLLTLVSHEAGIKKPRRLWIALAVCGLVWVGDIGYWARERFFRNDLRATVLDVGQGSALVLEFPGSAVYLLDGGGTNDNRIFDTAYFQHPFL